MTSDNAIKLIEMAEQIKRKISGYRLYDTAIDHDNINHLLVAAYLQGMVDAGLPVAREMQDAVDSML